MSENQPPAGTPEYLEYGGGEPLPAATPQSGGGSGASGRRGVSLEVEKVRPRMHRAVVGQPGRSPGVPAVLSETTAEARHQCDTRVRWQ